MQFMHLKENPIFPNNPYERRGERTLGTRLKHAVHLNGYVR